MPRAITIIIALAWAMSCSPETKKQSNTEAIPQQPAVSAEQARDNFPKPSEPEVPTATKINF